MRRRGIAATPFLTGHFFFRPELGSERPDRRASADPKREQMAGCRYAQLFVRSLRQIYFFGPSISPILRSTPARCRRLSRCAGATQAPAGNGRSTGPAKCDEVCDRPVNNARGGLVDSPAPQAGPATGSDYRAPQRRVPYAGAPPQQVSRHRKARRTQPTPRRCACDGHRRPRLPHPREAPKRIGELRRAGIAAA
jgi:hypothetical protein